ncbi:hypothetical protein LX15_005277 [Streptoalloteichus tenebrarius]|uniref:Uncharacterized protein n=1 Tax=Streptoalloteichus tenebrarius (strain ATCC 17920 / DSM 40477 / JCM 4838 / CBS 697.72 / NBRC 16177 / NCIMB 11028 / NRRL B-12390 / A12253. 1 / ISP 5477) TaxID=1933 RepID=A0ABT1I1C9_STRSD|nr:hypothetical protein [Streptoalloteichus tenebrarius]MCP2261551.1 hypothetical protein [Streptoalloteichus tenebrarius]
MHEPPHPDQRVAAQDPQEDEDRTDELLQVIGGGLLAAAPAGWRRIDLRALMASTVHDLTLTVVMEDGTTPAFAPPPQVVSAATDLRQLMYQPGLGTWFSMRYTMDPPSQFHVSFNFEHDPLWDPPVPPAVFAQDLEAFPRDDEHVPGWLRARLAGAREAAPAPPAPAAPTPAATHAAQGAWQEDANR